MALESSRYALKDTGEKKKQHQTSKRKGENQISDLAC